MGCRGAPFLFNPVSNQVIEHTNTIDHLGVNQQEDNVDITGNEKKTDQPARSEVCGKNSELDGDIRGIGPESCSRLDPLSRYPIQRPPKKNVLREDLNFSVAIFWKKTPTSLKIIKGSVEV